MNRRKTDPDEAEAVETARAQFDRALSERDALPRKEAGRFLPETDGWAGWADVISAVPPICPARPTTHDGAVRQ